MINKMLKVLFLVVSSTSFSQTINVATWNLEWQREKAMSQAEYDACSAIKPKKREQLPELDVNRWVCKSPEQIEELRAVARQMDADIIAVQEVENSAAAALIWPASEYDFYINMKSPWIQRTGFVVRKNSVIVEGVTDIPALGSVFNGDHSRHGLELQIKAKNGKSIKLLSVHLKSGCFDKALSSNFATRRDARKDVVTCTVLKNQAPALEEWLDSNLKAGFQVMIIGDFNRRFDSDIEFSKDANQSLFAELSDGDPVGATLFRPTYGFKAAKDCRVGGSPWLIDHVLMSGDLGRHYVGKSLVQYAASLHGSDHCAIRFSMKF